MEMADAKKTKEQAQDISAINKNDELVANKLKG